MTSDQRNHLRHLIDKEQRRRLEAAKPKDRRQSAATRRASYRAYYHRNREQISARKKARTLALKQREA